MVSLVTTTLNTTFNIIFAKQTRFPRLLYANFIVKCNPTVITIFPQCLAVEITTRIRQIKRGNW